MDSQYQWSRWVPMVPRWGGRLAGLFLLVLFVVFYTAHMAEGDSPPLSSQMFCLLAVVVGLGLTWWRELVGGVLVLLGMAGFYVLNLASSGGLPGGWFFPLVIVVGCLAIVSYAMHRTTRNSSTPR